MLFTIPPNEYKLDESALTGSLLGEDTAYQLSSSAVNVGTIGFPSVSAMSPIAEAVNQVVSENVYSHMEEYIAKNFSEELSSLHRNALDTSRFALFNEAAMVFGKSKDLQWCEDQLDLCCKSIQSFNMNAVMVNQIFQKVELKLEKYFGFANLGLSCKGVSGLGMIITKAMFNKNRNKTVDKLRNDADKKDNEVDRESLNRRADKLARENLSLSDNIITNSMGLALPDGLTSKKDFISQTSQQLGDFGANIQTKDGRIQWTSDISPYSYIEISMALLAARGMDGAALLSIILHEIGHSFYRGSIMSRTVSIAFSFIQTALQVFKIADHWLSTNAVSLIARSTALTNIYNVVYNGLFTLMNAYGSIFSLRLGGRIAGLLGSSVTLPIDIVSNLISIFSATQKILGTVMVGLSFGPSGLLYLLMNKEGVGGLVMTMLQTVSGDGLSEEEFCDNFAAAHGYGPDLVRAVQCFPGTNLWERGKAYEDQSTLSQIHAMTAYINSILVGIAQVFDVHPATESRPLLMVDYYKAELKKASTPKEKKYIEGLIAETIKASAYYSVSSSAKRNKLLNDAKKEDLSMFTKYSSSFMDVFKRWLSPDTGSLNNLSTVLMK